jgi:hypothetical protein
MAQDLNSIMAGWVDRGPYPYYDTLWGGQEPNTAGTLVTGATANNSLVQGQTAISSYSMFANGLSRTDPVSGLTKNKVLTNLPGVGGQFSPPRCLVLESIGFKFLNTRLVDATNFVMHAYFEFKIDDKVFVDGSFLDYADGGALYGVTNVQTDFAVSIGLPSVHATRRWGKYSRYIAPLQPFSLTIYFPYFQPTWLATAAGGQGIYFRATLDGLADRSVQ